MWRTHRKIDGMSSTIEIKVVTHYEYVTKDMLIIFFRCYVKVKST